MVNRLESASEIPPFERGTSPGVLHVELGIGRAPEPVTAALPESYGLPLLELLIVDTEFAFVSWEITSDQLERARTELGATGFEQRQLVLRVRSANASDRIWAEQELYGERGRWFFRHQSAGMRVIAELGFRREDSFMQLQAAGPVELPRDTVIEPDQYDELHVRYGVGTTGEIMIESTNRLVQAHWPEVNLPQPAPYELAAQRHPAAADSRRGLPSSPGPGLSGSPWSGGIFPNAGPLNEGGKDGE